MDTMRFLGLAGIMFAAVFLGMSWLFTVHPLQPDARLPTFQRVDTNDPRYKLEQSSVSDNDPTRDSLRNAVLGEAKSLADDPCNSNFKATYIKAVNAYARAWISIAPCLGTHTCGSSDSAKLDRAAQAFGSPLDHRLRELMRRIHDKRIFGPHDFPGELAQFVATMAGDARINPRAEEFRKIAAGMDDSAGPDCSAVR